MVDRQLKKIYYDPNNPVGFSGKRKLLTYMRKKIPTDKLVSWIEKQTAYNKHIQNRKKFIHRPYTTSNIDDLWEIDLMQVDSLKTYNDGVTYILVVVDVFSKYAWVEPLFNKTSQSTIRGLTNILKKSAPRRPIYIQSDKGKEFTNQSFQSFLKRKKILFRAARNPEVKASIAERFIRTIREKMFRYFTYSGSKRYIDILQALINSYNASYHNTIKTTPASVTLENASKIRKIMTERVKKIPDRAAKYSCGDLVRISIQKTAFQRGYTSAWTDEIFYISRISNIVILLYIEYPIWVEKKLTEFFTSKS